jgi:hypothetical protein
MDTKLPFQKQELNLTVPLRFAAKRTRKTLGLKSV